MPTKHGSEGNTKKPTLEFKVGFEGELKKTINTVAYAFSQSGKLIASAPVTGGSAQMEISPRQAETARIFFAPEDPNAKEESVVTLKTMAGLHAYEAIWRYDREQMQYHLLAIPQFLWEKWNWCSARVRGRVVKVETLGSLTFENPICRARVHICEVDRLPLLIARLPDLEIFKLRDELFRAIHFQIPIPIPNPPDPPFIVDPGFVDPVPAMTKAASLFGGKSATAGHPTVADTVRLNPQPLPPVLSLETSAALSARSAIIVRNALIKNRELIRLYCFDSIFIHYDCEELRVIDTDENGRFDTTVLYPCFGDKPDLYFWVEASIGQTFVSVYHPPIGCNTYWDYISGTDITIRVTDPRVQGCGNRPEVQGKKIVVNTIGRQVSMGEIYRTSSPPTADELAKQGQVIQAPKPAPFGATLELRVDFGNALRSANITHYRWSHRPLGSVALWQVIDKPVLRHYREATPPLSPVIYKSVQIGPDTDILVPGYYALIDPVLPPNGEYWFTLDEGFDLASAYFDTTVLAPGKHELKMELFRKVGAAMVRVDLTAEGVELHEMTSKAPLTEEAYATTAASGDRVLLDGTHTVGYRLVVHVDNRPCEGTIEDVVVNGLGAGHCGFLEYKALTEDARISFRASHPDNFATFSFGVVRVATPISEASASGIVEAGIAPDSVNGFNRVVVANPFSKDLTIQKLMEIGLLPNEKPCTRAAFAETLHVYALATNGYTPLTYLNKSAIKAFAITPTA